MHRTVLLLSTALIGGLFAAPVRAQQQTQTPAAEAKSDSDAKVGEIVVTAQRRDEKVQDVPISITALSAKDLARDGVTDIARLEQVTPGFTFGQSGSDARPSIRGVRTETVNATNDPSIGFYIDGIYQSRAQQALIPLVDVARVEVQRGPQGTLYGRNTFGGNISVVTNAPTDHLAGGLSARIGDYGDRRYEAYLNVPLSDTLQIRAAGVRNISGGFVTSVANPAIHLFDRHEWLGRLSAKWTPTANFEVLLRGGYWQNEGQGGGAYGYRVAGTLINLATGLRSVYGAPVAVNPTVHDGSDFIAGVDVGVPVAAGPYQNNWDYVPFEHTHEYFSSAQINWTLGNVVLRSITGFEKFRTDRSADLDQTAVVFPAPGVTSGFAANGYQENDTHDRSWSEELQLASVKTRPLQWIVGLYGLKDDIDEPYSQFYTDPNNTVAGTTADTRVNVSAYAAYGQASYFIVPDRLRLTGGVRYTDETKDFGIVNHTFPAGGSETTGASSSGSPHFTKATWRAGADYFITPHNMIYFQASTGFRSGGINNNSTNALIPASFGPENVTAYEIGSKNRFADGKVQLNLSAFDYRFQDLQITILDQLTNLSYIQNAGRAHSKGGEAVLDVVPVSDLHLSASAVYLEAKFDQYIRPNDFYTATNGDPHLLNFAGHFIPMSPKWKLTGGVYYDFKSAALGKITPVFNWLHSSSYYTLDYNTVLDRQSAYDKIDARIIWRLPDERYALEVFANNITNVAVLNRSVLGNSQRVQQSYEPPRTYGLQVSADF